MKTPENTPQAFGATGDGCHDDAPAIQAALNANRLLRIPSGRYLLGQTLRLPSGTRIIAADDAVFKLADGAAKNRHDYVVSNADIADGNEEIEIEGGRWDGNNAGNPRPPGLLDEGPTGALMHFENVKKLRLENLTLHNAEAYYARFTGVSEFHIENIRFDSDRIRPNNDGIHLGGDCCDGLIKNLKGLLPGVTGDDMVALNADDAQNRTEVRGMRCGPIRRIRISHVRADGCHSFVRLLSVHSLIEDILIEDIEGTCEISALNCDAARGCRVQVFDPSDPAHANGVGMLRRIRARDFRVAKSKNNEIALLRLETRMEDFLIENFQRMLPRDAALETPTLRMKHLPAGAFLLDGETRSLGAMQEFAWNGSQFNKLSLGHNP